MCGAGQTVHNPGQRIIKTYTSKAGRRYTQRFRVSPFTHEYEILSQDKAIRLYWANLTRPNKPIPEHQKKLHLLAALRFLQRLNKPITTTAISELIAFKKSNPNDTTLEQELTLWKAEATSSTILNNVARICGIFRKNFTPLDIHIHVSSDHQTIPIAEPTLLAIYNDSQQRERDAIELMAFGAERVAALGRLPLENVRLVENSTVAILDIPAHLAKTGHRHPSIIPKSLAERLLENAQRLGYKTLLPNYHSIWERISAFAKTAYHVELTSHYFRKRFETRCEKVPANEMNPNHWMVLMGSKPTLGHMPEIYSLMSDHELIQEYETYLMPGLELSGETFKAQPSQLEQLRRENAELKEQLIRLSKLLTERA